MIREQRFQRTQLRTQSSMRSDSIGRITGYAAKFWTKSEDLGGFRETIASSAFDKALASNPDVRFLRDHNPTIILGRTKAGTLALSTDAIGLRFAVDLPDTSQARDLMTSINRGDVSQCSFAFTVDDDGEDWSDDTDDDGNSSSLRTLRSVSLLDCSAVTYPAYQDTEVNVDPTVLAMGRSLWPQEIPVEVRSHVPGITQRSSSTSVERRKQITNFILGL